MSSGQLDKPVYILPEQLTLLGIEEAVAEQEHLSAEDVRRRSESALAALSALRVKSVNKETGEVKEGEPRWMELYRKLREDHRWKWRVAVYVAWACMPRRYRWPETQDELAKQCLGLGSDRAITEWRRKNPIIDEYITILQGEIVFDRIPDALDAMSEVASMPDYKGNPDRKLMFEMSGKYTPSSKITAEMAKHLVNSKPADLEDLSDEELRRIELNVRQTLDDRHEEEAE